MEVKLTNDDLIELNTIVNELPHKYAVQIIAFFNRKISSISNSNSNSND